MNNRNFGLLLSAINVLSIVTFEKYWKHGIKITWKRKQSGTSPITLSHVPVSGQASEQNIQPLPAVIYN
jgi:hypothetical protein